VINPNKAVVERIFAELALGNGRPLLEHIADDCRWRVIGSTTWSGQFHGKSAIRKQLLGPLASRLSDAYRAAASRIIAEGDIVVVEARGNNRTTSGRVYNNEYCFVIHLSGDPPLMREITEYADTELMSTALGALE